MSAPLPPTPEQIVEQSMTNILGYNINVYGAFLMAVLVVFLIAMWKAQKAKRLDWLDMLTRDGTKVSTTKILQLIGGIVGTWIVVKVTLQGVLTWDIFAIYLSYVASIDGFSKLIMAKYGAAGSDDSSAPYRRNSSYLDQTYRPPGRVSKNTQPDFSNEEDDLDHPVSRGSAKTDL